MHRDSRPTGSAAEPDLGLIFDLSPLALLTLSPSRCITRASSRFLTGWRVAADDCVGQPLLPFVEKQLVPLSSPTYLAHLTAAVDGAIAARAERTSTPIQTRHASSWTARVIPVFNGDELLSVVVEWREVSSRPPEDESVQGLSTDEAFRIFVQGVKDYAIFLLDTKGCIATWNTGAQLLKGYTRDDIIGKHFSIFYSKEDVENKKPEMELEICLREGRVEDEGWRYRKDGRRFWANVVITAVYRNGVHVGFGKVTRDLSERKSTESRLISAYEESEKIKSDFLANMSHEIRTPMHGMLSACTLLLDTPLSPSQRDIVSIMDESGQVLLQVINDILDYSKLTSGSFSIHTDVVGITSIVTSVVRRIQTTLPPSVHFELFLSPDLPRSVQGDPLRYRQILQNLVGNAAKFTDKGSIQIRALVESDDGDNCTILTEVTDTGIGVPEAAVASLFAPFTQFDATTTKRYKGAGLGLSIAKSLTELMGGRIGYRPNPERHGSVFWFTARFTKIKSLDQVQDWKKAVREEGRAGAASPDSDLENLRQELRMVSTVKNLLVVEDNLINQKVMIGMLRSIGFKNIGLAANGEEAVKMVRGKPAAYDLVLMDINMPLMDGYQATRNIRAGGILVPIVAMTAYALKGDKEKCLDHGMNDYITKPVNKTRLITVLGKWLLKTVDYRKTFEERLSELRRHEEAAARKNAEKQRSAAAVVNGVDPIPVGPVAPEAAESTIAVRPVLPQTEPVVEELQPSLPPNRGSPDSPGVTPALNPDPAGKENDSSPAMGPNNDVSGETQAPVHVLEPAEANEAKDLQQPTSAAEINEANELQPPALAAPFKQEHNIKVAKELERSPLTTPPEQIQNARQDKEVNELQPLTLTAEINEVKELQQPTHTAPSEPRLDATEVKEVTAMEKSSFTRSPDQKHDATKINELPHDTTPFEENPCSPTSSRDGGRAQDVNNTELVIHPIIDKAEASAN